jgi:hemerythrin-like domain-containing protein
MTDQNDTIDFTMMYVTHDAFRRDLARLVGAADDGQVDRPGVRAGWENFKKQLHLHHTVEDEHLWPVLRAAVAGDADRLWLLDQMEQEHAAIDPLLAATDKAWDGPAEELAMIAREMSEVLGHHLEHEEVSALPLIQEVLTNDDWRGFGNQMRKRQGVSGAAVYVPWILDGALADQRRRFLGMLPGPVGVLNKLFWARRYRRLGLWR